MPWDTHRKPIEFAKELKSFEMAMKSRARILRRNAKRGHGGAPVPEMVAARLKAADALEAAAALLANRVFADFSDDPA